MKISNDILAILAECKIEDCVLYLPQMQLDRSTYAAVNKVLENIGGKWNKSKKGHVFDADPTNSFETLLFTGETEDMKKTFQFFPTPKELGEKVVEIAELKCLPFRDHCNVLEPSAGKGDLADVIFAKLEKSDRHDALICVELNREMKPHLDNKPYTSMVGVDFMSLKVGEIKPFDRIVMNPPFTRLQDIDHVLHAYDLLYDGGILVSVMSCSPFFRTDKKSTAFMVWLKEKGATITDVPAGAFKESGTMVATKIIKVMKDA